MLLLYELIFIRMCLSLIFFFFSSRRRHTRYIGDWSSDVCSSDLHLRGGGVVRNDIARDPPVEEDLGVRARHEAADLIAHHRLQIMCEPGDSHNVWRSEERRVGKECRGWKGGERVKGKQEGSVGGG